MSREASQDEVARTAESIEGFLTRKEGAALYDLAKACRGRGAIVEIGSWKGKSTVWLASGSRAGAGTVVHAVDPHTGNPEHRESMGDVDTLREFGENIRAAGLERMVKPIVGTSERAAQELEGPVELVFVDGGHGYADVTRDFDLWFERLVEGGTMAFHDTRHIPGPYKVVARFVFGSPRFRNARLVDSLAIAERTSARSWADAARSRLVLLWLQTQFYATLAGKYVAFALWRRPINVIK